jgi:hypothetical protein
LTNSKYRRLSHGLIVSVSAIRFYRIE